MRFARPKTRGPQQPAAPSPHVVLLAALSLTAALILSAEGEGGLAALAAFVAVGATGAELLLVGRWEGRSNAPVIGKLLAQVQAGRRLAIYDRDTGLFAHWYLLLRGEEEVARAVRYGRSLSVVVLEPQAAHGSAWELKANIARWLHEELRATDIAGYLGNARFAVLLPEAGPAEVERVVGRLRASVEAVESGAATLPEDGDTYAALWQAAAGRLPAAEADAA